MDAQTPSIAYQSNRKKVRKTILIMLGLAEPRLGAQNRPYEHAQNKAEKCQNSVRRIKEKTRRVGAIFCKEGLHAWEHVQKRCLLYVPDLFAICTALLSVLVVGCWYRPFQLVDLIFLLTNLWTRFVCKPRKINQNVTILICWKGDLQVRQILVINQHWYYRSPCECAQNVLTSPIYMKSEVPHQGH